ncbi:hypothetical protein ACFLYU_02995 [Candidatus Dependentiae bacterium]
MLKTRKLVTAFFAASLLVAPIKASFLDKHILNGNSGFRKALVAVGALGLTSLGTNAALGSARYIKRYFYFKRTRAFPSFLRRAAGDALISAVFFFFGYNCFKALKK